MPPTPSQTPPLTSLWGDLSPHLIAVFYEVDRKGNRVNPDVEVQAPLTEANFEATLNWQSPFENASPETTAPALLAMLQSGTLQPWIDNAGSVVGRIAKAFGADGDSLKREISAYGQALQGRSGITKLNSTQIFTGMPPVKIPVTALFRAWRDPVSEVEAPVDQLMQWALPTEIAPDSTLLTRLGDKVTGSDKSWIDEVLPSKSPTLIAMHYKGRTYAPLVIESIGLPISSPVTEAGQFVELAVPMTLATLTAIDRQDWAKMRG